MGGPSGGARVRRAWPAGLLVALTPVLAAGCSSTAPSTGVTRIDRAVVVAYKPCEGSEAIGRLELYGSDDPTRPVWTAVHVAGDPAALDLPVIPQYPGYTITDDRPDGELDPDQRYSFEATGTEGTEWGGPGFRVGDLVQGRVRVAGQDLAFRDWVDSPASCPEVGLAGALLTGGVMAGIAGGALVLFRLLTRRGRRAAPPGA